LDAQHLILIIEDDEFLLNSLENILQKANYTVEKVTTGKEALEKLKNVYYSLILLDVKLPDMDGIQIILEIEETSPKMRKIIMTGYPSVEKAQQAINYGADAFLVKPFSPEVLLKEIKKQLVLRDKEMKELYGVFIVNKKKRIKHKQI